MNFDIWYIGSLPAWAVTTEVTWLFVVYVANSIGSFKLVISAFKLHFKIRLLFVVYSLFGL